MKKAIMLWIVCMAVMIPLQANTKEVVTLAKCTDGDTAHFRIDGSDTTVRFLAINAPEYTKEQQPYGKEASAYVCDTLTKAKRIELEYDDGSDRSDKYGRTLAWVYADGVLIQKELVRQGLAEVTYIYGDYAYTDELRKLEKEAKKQKRNMWSDAVYEDIEEDDSLPYIMSIAAGILLILLGLFTRGKRRQTRLIKEGVKQFRRK